MRQDEKSTRILLQESEEFNATFQRHIDISLELELVFGLATVIEIKAFYIFPHSGSIYESPLRCNKCCCGSKTVFFSILSGVGLVLSQRKFKF